MPLDPVLTSYPGLLRRVYEDSRTTSIRKESDGQIGQGFESLQKMCSGRLWGQCDWCEKRFTGLSVRLMKHQ